MKPHADVGEAGLALSRARALDYAALTKPRITVFVALSTAVGFVMGAGGAPDLLLLLHTLLATLLIAGGAAALNQFMERDLDARMRRTADRPLPSGRLQPEEAYLFGLLLSGGGVLYMGLRVNWLAGLVAALTTLVYLFLYTPLKQKTASNTAVGAVAGALPPVGGWAAAQGEVGGAAWALFAILFFWQFPHFYSIAWMHREDYARGGFRMLPVEDAAGVRTARQVVFYSLVLLLCGLAPAFLGLSGTVYLLGAVPLGLWLLYCGFLFARFRTEAGARRLMRATLVYLPALWTVMLLDRLVL